MHFLNPPRLWTYTYVDMLFLVLVVHGTHPKHMIIANPVIRANPRQLTPIIRISSGLKWSQAFPWIQRNFGRYSGAFHGHRSPMGHIPKHVITC